MGHSFKLPQAMDLRGIYHAKRKASAAEKNARKRRMVRKDLDADDGETDKEREAYLLCVAEKRSSVIACIVA